MRLRALLTATAAICLIVAAVDSAEAAPPCWRPPVAGAIFDHFREPSCPYCAGNRGIEYRPVAGGQVRSVEAGRVTFSGPVAGTTYVIVEHVDGWTVTYGRLQEVFVERGVAVGRGEVLGSVDRAFYFGVRVNGRYQDPEPFLGRLVGRPRLVPIDATQRRPPPAATWSCGMVLMRGGAGVRTPRPR